MSHYCRAAWYGAGVLMLLLFAAACGDSDDTPAPEQLTGIAPNVSGFSFTFPATDSPLRVQLSETDAFQALAFDSVYESGPAVITGLKSDTRYFLRAQFTAGPSPFSQVQELRTQALTTPVNISADQILGDEFRISWNEVTGASYSLDVAFDDAFSQPVGLYTNFSVTSNQVTVEVPQTETAYYYRLRSVNGNQQSENSGTGMVTTTDQLVFTFRSPAFVSGGKIPAKYSCQGGSIPLNWKNPPEGTESLALIMDDLDFAQGVYNHWVVFNLAGNSTGLLDGASGTALPIGVVEGTNDLGGMGYFGPCPPANESHRYEFKLYALDRQLSLPATTTKAGLLAAMEGKTLGTKSIIGVYN